MSIFDKLKELTAPYDDEDDFFEGADSKFKPQPTIDPSPVSKEQALFEASFANGADSPPASEAAPVRKAAPRAQAKAPNKSPFVKMPAQSAPAAAQPDGSIFGNLGKKQTPPPRQGRVSFAGRETQVILFVPRSFEEAGELVNHLRQNRSIVMTLDGLADDMAIRLMDFISGIVFALDKKITPVSAKTYFIGPQNVDIHGGQAEQAETDGQYL